MRRSKPLDELTAKVVVAADGINSFISQDAGIRAKEPMKNLAVGVKSVIKLSEEKVRDRFHLTGDEGAAARHSGFAHAAHSALAPVSLMTLPQRVISVRIQSLNCLGELATTSNSISTRRAFTSGEFRILTISWW